MAVQSFFRRKEPLPRQFVHALFWIYLALAPAFWFGAIHVYHGQEEWFLGPLALMSAGALLIPYLAFHFFSPRSNEEDLLLAEVLVGLATIVSWVGAFGLYRTRLSYDTFVHVFNSAAVTMAFGLLLRSRDRASAFLLAGLLAMSGGVANELFEWGGDHVWGTSMYGEQGDPQDTRNDLVANLAGMGTVTAVSYFWLQEHKKSGKPKA